MAWAMFISGRSTFPLGGARRVNTSLTTLSSWIKTRPYSTGGVVVVPEGGGGRGGDAVVGGRSNLRGPMLVPSLFHLRPNPCLFDSVRMRTPRNLFHTSPPFHQQSLTRDQIDQEPDVRNLLDSYYQPTLPPDQRSTNLSHLIQNMLSFTDDPTRLTPKEKHLLKLAYVYKGKALSEMDKKDEALAEIEKGEKTSPDGILYFEKARLLSIMNHYSSAVRYLGKTIADLIPGDPLYVESLLTRAQCHHHMGDKVKALQDINEVLFYQPENLRSRLEKGRFLLDDNPEAAIAEYEAVLDDEKIDRDTKAEAYFRIGYAYLKKGDLNVAIRSLQQSKRTDPKHPRVAVLKEIMKDIESKIPKIEGEGEGGGTEGEKPERKRATRQRKKAEGAEGEGEGVEGADGTEPKKPRRRAAKVAEGSSVEGESTEIKPTRRRASKAEGTTVGDTEGTEPKQPRRRATKATAEGTSVGDTEGTEPKQPRRRTTKATEGTNVETTESTEPKQPTRRRTTKPTEGTNVEATESTEPKQPTRRRTTKPTEGTNVEATQSTEPKQPTTRRTSKATEGGTVEGTQSDPKQPTKRKRNSKEDAPTPNKEGTTVEERTDETKPKPTRRTSKASKVPSSSSSTDQIKA